MIDEIIVENMSHIADSFPARNHSYRDDDRVHPSQRGSSRIKLVLLFVIPGAENADRPRIASVRVPKGTAIFKLRQLIRHCEQELINIYGRAKRVNFVMTCPEHYDVWTYQYDLPVTDVVYI